MHVVRYYDPNEAENIFRAVKAFLCRLAEDVESIAQAQAP
ncbi:MAG: hypothetical protein QOE82_1613 [Thermoanaerobaculia bacterium]|jgi:hypothetical protein|nr:hypothetical protein [Thermoanaerobaculia bacterium]